MLQKWGIFNGPVAGTVHISGNEMEFIRTEIGFVNLDVVQRIDWNSDGCVSACKIDPLGGVIGVLF